VLAAGRAIAKASEPNRHHVHDAALTR
jgi:hypothetical protein